MATTLSKGYILPANPDTGDVFWPALSTDIILMNNHVHDGVTGAILPVVTQNIPSSGWGSKIMTQPELNNYAQVVTVPSQFSFDTVQINFKLANGTQIFPTITRTSSSQFTIYTNDNTQNFVAVYSA